NDERLSDAAGSFSYDDEVSEDLELHVHLYLLGNAIASDSGSATHEMNLHLSASFGDVKFEATSADTLWTVSGNLPTGDVFYTSNNTVSDHRAFTVPFGGDANLVALTGYDIDGRVQGHSTGGSTSGIAGMTATAWCYVTPVGEDVDPGDFNADGSVD